MNTPEFRNFLRWVPNTLEWIGANVQRFFNEGHFRRPRSWVALLLAVIVLFSLQHCVDSSHKKTAPAELVVLAPVRVSDVPIYISALGNVTPNYTVIVKTQITGQLLRVLFKEGQMVKAGDLLAEIDPRPYEALLAQYEGQLARDQALLVNAELDLKRYSTLWRQDSVAKQTYDTEAAVVKQNEGTVKLDQGLIQGVKVNLIYTKITSPIDGRVGLRLVDPGNVVQTSDTTGIAVINMLNPITVVFSIPEDSVPLVMEQLTAGKTLTVQAYNRDQTKLLDTSTLLTIDNQIDPTTGTVKLKALFQNEAHLLFPNQFVNVKLLVKTLEHATVVPTAAIQHTTQGAFVYVLKSDHTVSIKTVVVGPSTEVDTVVTGVTSGQSVVVEGTDKLVEGSLVTVASDNQQSPLKTANAADRRRIIA
ncbi:MAG: efflux RND transporter periplasmic adaptor subunit [Gammaproteobacteria bacterium]